MILEQDNQLRVASTSDSAIHRGTAIVAEGGGQRGIYTAGVLDTFLRYGFNPFELGLGASAGAQNLSTYFLDLPEYAKWAIAELSVSPEILVPYRWLGRRSVLDLDRYFSTLVDDPVYRFPCARMDQLAGRRRLIFVAASRSDLTATYLEPDSSNVLTYMKASSAVPFLYKNGVVIGSKTFVDGGVADPLPVRQACTLGANRVVVIRTVPVQDSATCWRRRLKALRLGKAMPAMMSSMLDSHEKAYEDALNFMRQPPPGVEFFQIAPEAPLCSQVFGSHADTLLADYASGCRDGKTALAQLGDWCLSPPSNRLNCGVGTGSMVSQTCKTGPTEYNRETCKQVNTLPCESKCPII